MEIYYTLIRLWNKTDIDTAYSPQVCYIRKALNDILDPEERRFLVIDSSIRGKMLFTIKDNEPHTQDKSICRITKYRKG